MARIDRLPLGHSLCDDAYGMMLKGIRTPRKMADSIEFDGGKREELLEVAAGAGRTRLHLRAEGHPSQGLPRPTVPGPIQAPGELVL